MSDVQQDGTITLTEEERNEIRDKGLHILRVLNGHRTENVLRKNERRRAVPLGDLMHCGIESDIERILDLAGFELVVKKAEAGP